MFTDSILTGPIPPANAEAVADESVLARLAWMSELEASLNGSRKALLALDLAGPAIFLKFPPIPCRRR